MFRKQNLTYKILCSLAGVILHVLIYAQNPDAQTDLQRADSLFKAEKYTESLGLYQQLMDDHQQYSKGMLLKMAYIKEGLGNYSEALYYLNLYYAESFDKRALRKMEELARQHNLQGYQSTDLDFLQVIYQEYRWHVTMALLAAALFLFSYILWKKRRRHARPVVSGAVFVLVLGLLFALVNYGQESDKAIVLTDQAYLRKAPSSAADVVGIISKGNRVEVSTKKDVWVKIEWEDQNVFIRESHLAFIRG